MTAKPRQWTDRDNETLRRLWPTDIETADICTRFGMTGQQRSLNKHAKRIGLPSRDDARAMAAQQRKAS